MKIDGYSFGRVVIGGKEYTSDIIIGKDFLKTSWWRKEGHRVQEEDIEEILKYKPEIVIFGTGANAMVKVDENVIKKLENLGCKVYIEPTNKAVKLYNELLESGKKVILAAHLTC